MITTIDWIMISLISLFLISGFIKGFLSTIVGPFSLLVSLILCWLFFTLTKNIALTIVVGFLIPIIIGILICLLIKIFTSDNNNEISLISRLAGSLFNFIWGGSLLIGLLILLSVISWPTKNIQEIVKQSFSYQFMSKNPLFNSLLHQTQSETSEETLQKLLNNPDIIQALKKNDLSTLLSHPAIQQIQTDPQKVLNALQSKIESTHHPFINDGDEN